MLFTKPTSFTEAIDKLTAKQIVTAGLDTEAWRKVPVGLRDRAFFSSRIESARFLQRGRGALGDFLQGATEEVTLADGSVTTALKVGSRADFVKQMQDFAIGEGMGPLDVEDMGGLKDITSERRLGLIYDVQTRSAQDYGYWQQGQDENVVDAFPAQRFIRERPVKEPRDFHTREEGVVRLKSDLAFWKGLNQDFGVPWGPWGWGCGHDVEDVDRDEAESLGLIEPGESARPVEQEFNEQLKASTEGLDPDVVDQLKSSFGDQVEIQDGTARWKP